uniref:Uncharacterized protein n=1 Tax=Arundo donax TaxID=35708 RepID=A0A0A8YJY1_ARUDO
MSSKVSTEVRTFYYVPKFIALLTDLMMSLGVNWCKHVKN